MPNRIIKESICRSDTINLLKPFEEILFYRLIVVCDDYGRFDGRPEIIKGSCFPLKDTAVKDIGSALERLAEVGLVELYKVQGKPVLQLSSWSVHQQIRAKKSKYPAPDENCNQLISDDCNIPRNRESKYENRESYSRNENAHARESVEVHRFEDFWEAYPLGKNRYLSEQAYIGIVSDGICSEDELVESAKNYAEYCKITGTDKIYHANNFLEKCAFEDYLHEKYKKPTPNNQKKGKSNQFNQFQQNDYDFTELENDLLSN